MILWTRIDATDSVAVDWWIGESLDGTDPVRSGTDTTDVSRDHTVKVDATGLDADTPYYYGFSALGASSPVGRTRTAPDSLADGLRLAVVSCSNYQDGFFNGYARIAERTDLAAVIHLGDYIYEHKDGGHNPARGLDPLHEAVTLEDYRRRYAWYRRDADLQAAHAAHPFIITWDDHEYANDAWMTGASNHDPDEGEGDWNVRKLAAQQAFYEWLPVREGAGPIYRTVTFGGLMDLVLLDTRIEGREQQVVWNQGPVADPTRQIISEEQFEWLFTSLSASTARWKLIGSQVPLLPQFHNVRKTDSWEGYPEARLRLFNFMRWSGVDNIVTVSGDIHSSWAADLPDNFDLYATDPRAASVGVEFVSPAISSRAISNLFVERIPLVTAHVRITNPHVKDVDLEERGYLVLDVNTERIRGDWYFSDVSQLSHSEWWGFGYEVQDGETVLTPVSEGWAMLPTPRRGVPPRTSWKPQAH